MALSQDSRPFLERAGLIPFRRGPVPRMDLARHPIHSVPVAPPLPSGEASLDVQGLPPPDRGRTKPWPYPEE